MTRLGDAAEDLVELGGDHLARLRAIQGDLACEFEVEEEARDVELVVELRCRAGSLSVKAESVWLTRVE